ncbi:hypothetical protein ACET3Z_028070 [Daucus carota]
MVEKCLPHGAINLFVDHFNMEDLINTDEPNEEKFESGEDSEKDDPDFEVEEGGETENSDATEASVGKGKEKLVEPAKCKVRRPYLNLQASQCESTQTQATSCKNLSQAAKKKNGEEAVKKKNGEEAAKKKDGEGYCLTGDESKKFMEELKGPLFNSWLQFSPVEQDMQNEEDADGEEDGEPDEDEDGGEDEEQPMTVRRSTRLIAKTQFKFKNTLETAVDLDAEDDEDA